MRITGANWNDFESIRDCKYQQTFPILNADALDVICTKGVDIEGKGAFEYAHLCKDCVGKDCGNYESRYEDKG